ncbi:MAG: DUF3843 family protein [Muribaculaceae bacterium]
MANKKTTGASKKILVSARDWQEVHPLGLKCKSDGYYSILSTRLANMIREMIGDGYDIHSDDIKACAIELAAYLEDKLTGLNMWNAFIALYQERFGRRFPFYDDIAEDDMLSDEPNLPDVRFLLWRGINRANPDTILNPLNAALVGMTGELYGVLLEEYEHAPESPELYDTIFRVDFNDTLLARGLCGFMVTRGYLTACDDVMDPFQQIYDLVSSAFGDDMPEHAKSYAIETYFYVGIKVGPLAVPPYEWIAKMMELSADAGIRAIAGRFKDMAAIPYLPFGIVSVSDEYFEVENIAGERLTVSYDTLWDDSRKDVIAGRGMIASLLKYDGMWHINGLSSFTDKAEDFTPMTKEYSDRRQSQEQARKVQLDHNGGSPIGVTKDWKELETRFEFDKATDKTEGKVGEDVKKGTDLLYFINDDSSMSILPDGAKAVALPANLYYDPAEAANFAALLIVGHETTEDMRRYLLAHGLLPDARLKGPQPDPEAKAWFAANAPFLAALTHTDTVSMNLP